MCVFQAQVYFLYFSFLKKGRDEGSRGVFSYFSLDVEASKLENFFFRYGLCNIYILV